MLRKGVVGEKGSSEGGGGTKKASERLKVGGKGYARRKWGTPAHFLERSPRKGKKKSSRVPSFTVSEEHKKTRRETSGKTMSQLGGEVSKTYYEGKGEGKKGREEEEERERRFYLGESRMGKETLKLETKKENIIGSLRGGVLTRQRNKKAKKKKRARRNSFLGDQETAQRYRGKRRE